MNRFVDWAARHPMLTASIAAVYAATVLFGHDVGQAMAGWLQKVFTDRRLDRMITIGVLAGTAFLAAAVWKALRDRPMRGPRLACGVITLAFAAAAYNTLFMVNTETIHFPQYAVLGALLLPLVGRYGETVLLVTLLGAADEAYQYWVSNAAWEFGYLDFNDIVLNLIGGAMGVALMAVFVAPDKLRRTRGGAYGWREFIRSPVFLMGAFVTAVGLALFASGYATLLPDPSAPIFLRKSPPDVTYWIVSHWGKTCHTLMPGEGVLLTWLLILPYVAIDRRLSRQLPGEPVTPLDARRYTAVAVIIAATVAVYANSFAGVFLFDEHQVILENDRIRQFWPPWPYLESAVRPLLYTTLALNYAVSGLRPWSYHAFNLALHVSAAVLLFSVIRHTLRLPRGGSHDAIVATALASIVALLWAVHPLQTQSVTYIVQRGEIMAAACILLVLWCVIHETSAAGARQVMAWRAAAIGAFALGLSAKETAVAAVPLVILYDRALLTGGWRAALARRWPLYAGMVLLPGTIALARWVAGAPLQFYVHAEWSPATYLLNQGPVILHYLRLAFWPHPLVFDYGWQPINSGIALLAGGVLSAAIVAAFRSLDRRPAIGFAVLAFFILLAPTSSILPIEDMAVEHRMYLPLALVIAMAVVAGGALLHALIERAPLRRAVAFASVALMTAVFGTMTWARNRDYHDELRMWEDVVSKRPGHARAYYNAGVRLLADRRFDDAGRRFEQAVAADPEYAKAHSNLGVLFALRGERQRAEQSYAEALRHNPALPEAYVGLANLLASQGRRQEAAPYYDAAIALAGDSPGMHLTLGRAKAALGEFERARSHYTRALERRPDFADAHNGMGLAWAAEGDFAKAIDSYTRALAADPAYAAAHNNIGAALARLGRTSEAMLRYTEALRIDPGFAEAHHNIGLIQAERGDLHAAIASHRRALAVMPDYADAYLGLGTALAGAGRREEAVDACRRALLIRPDFAEAHNNLGAVLLQLARPHEAAVHLQRAIEIRPDYEAARRNLSRAVLSTLVAFDLPESNRR